MRRLKGFGSNRVRVQCILRRKVKDCLGVHILKEYFKLTNSRLKRLISSGNKRNLRRLKDLGPLSRPPHIQKFNLEYVRAM